MKTDDRAPAPAPANRSYRRLRRSIGFLVGIGLVLFILSRVDTAAMLEALRSYRAEYFPIVAALMLLHFLLDGAVQYALLDARRVKAATFIVRVCQMHLFSLFLPGRVGDVSLFFLVREESKGKLLKAYVFARLFAVCMLAAFAAPLLGELTRTTGVLYLAAALAALSLLTAAFFRLDRLKERLAEAPLVPFREKLRAMEVARPTLRGYVLAMVLLLARQIVTALCFHVILLAAGAPMPFLALLPLTCLVRLGGLLPITPLGLGVIELLMTEMLRRYGIPPEVGLTVPLVARAAQMACFGLFALTLLRKHRRSNAD